jgi:protein-disulfide isomerase
MRNPTLALLFLSLSMFVTAQTKPSVKSAAGKPVQPGETKLPTEEEVNAFMHVTFGYNPQLTWKIVSIKPSQAAGLSEVNVLISGPEGQGTQRFFVSEDGQHAVVGDIIPFGKHPFDKARAELQKKANGPSRGAANAPVTVVEFSDLQCPHCKEANPTIERLIKEDPEVHFVFQNFPLPSHNWAQKAAQYADCVGRASNDAFWKFVDAVFAAQNDITADNADQKLTALADQSGVKGSDMATCSTQPDTQSRVEASINLGKSLDVNSTPSLFINGRPVGVAGNNYDVLKQLVDFSVKEK